MSRCLLQIFSCALAIASFFVASAPTFAQEMPGKPAQDAAPVLVPPPAPADSGTTDAKPPKPPRTYASMSVGGSTGSRGAILCAEVAPLSFLSISGCGNGSGFLHHDDAPDLSHWRINGTVYSFKTGALWLQPRVQLGFAEVQVGQDTPGFDFTSTNEAATSTSGIESGASLRALWPIRQSGFEVIGEVGFSVGYFPHAEALVRPQSTWIPSGSLTVGVGF